jgi:hypothetical protein
VGQALVGQALVGQTLVGQGVVASSRETSYLFGQALMDKPKFSCRIVTNNDKLEIVVVDMHL